MKKTAILLTALLMVFSLVLLSACGNASESTTGSSGESTGAPESTSGEAVSTSDPASSAAPESTAQPAESQEPETAGQPDEPDEPEGIAVDNAKELASVFHSINNMKLPEDSVITLTADIDLSGYTDTDTWEPLYRFSGTLNGAGHTISGLDWNFVMAEGADTDMPLATETSSYVFENLDNSLGGNCYARATVSLLILQLNGGEVKNLTLKDSAMTIHCSYNRNYLMFFGAVVGYVNGGTLSGVKLENVDMTIPAEVNYNHAFVGWAAPLVGRVTGQATFSSCSADADCLVDASENAKTNTGKLIGIMDDKVGPLTVENCASDAETRVHPEPESETLTYHGDDIVWGGVASDDLVGEDLGL